MREIFSFPQLQVTGQSRFLTFQMRSERQPNFILNLSPNYMPGFFGNGHLQNRFGFPLTKLPRHARAMGFDYKMVSRITPVFQPRGKWR